MERGVPASVRSQDSTAVVCIRPAKGKAAHESGAGQVAGTLAEVEAGLSAAMGQGFQRGVGQMVIAMFVLLVGVLLAAALTGFVVWLGFLLGDK